MLGKPSTTKHLAKKVLACAVSLVTAVAFTVPAIALAGTGPYSGDSDPNEDGAFLYIYDYGQPTDDNYYTLYRVFSTIAGEEVTPVPGGKATYNRASNTLTLNNYNADASIGVDSMGEDFTIEVIGSNSIHDIDAYSDGAWGSGIKIVGSGTLDINKGKVLGVVPIAARTGADAANMKLEVASTVTLNMYADSSEDVLVRIDGASVKSPADAMVFNGDHVGISDRLYDDSIPARSYYSYPDSEQFGILTAIKVLKYKGADDEVHYYAAVESEGSVEYRELDKVNDGGVEYFEYLENSDDETDDVYVVAKDPEVIQTLKEATGTDASLYDSSDYGYRAKAGDAEYLVRGKSQILSDDPEWDVYEIVGQGASRYDEDGDSANPLTYAKYKETVANDASGAVNMPQGYAITPELVNEAARNIYYLTGASFTQTAKVEAPAPVAPVNPTPAVKAGDTATVGGQQVKVTSASTVQFTKSANRKNVTVPDAVTLADGRSYEVTSVGAKAFAGKKVRTVAIGRNVAKLARNAFKGSKATKVVVKTKRLSKKAVKGCFAGSKVKTVQVKVGGKKANRAQVKKYKKVFTKKLTGTKAKKLVVK